MKVAVITEDGENISQHFGRAPFYKVFTIENGVITHREMRDKLGHQHFSSQHQVEEHQGQTHGTDPQSHDKHVSMAEAIADCQALLCGGMGMGAYQSMRQLNIQPIVTDHVNIEAAVKSYIDGSIQDHIEKLH